jgi:beta-barrel assembly-enhancing protease
MESMREIKATKLFIIPFLLFVAFIATGCAVNPVTGQNQLMLVSEGDEVEMGRSLYPNAIWSAEGGGGEYKDEPLKTYLKEIVIDLHRVSHRPNLPVSFAIQNTSMPNAWAIPGHVVMTRGLLAGLDNEAEFAFVMGHEIGHVSARHSASQMSQGMLHQLLLQGGTTFLGAGAYSDTALALGSIGSNLLLLKYSREDELQADRLGVEYMTKLGYNPNNALSAQESVERIASAYLKSLGKNAEERGFFEDLLSSHPRTSTRMGEMGSIVRSAVLTTVKGDGANRKQFQAMTAGVRKMNYIYQEYYDKAVRALKNGNTAEASTLIARAIAQDPAQAPFHSLNGYILLSRRQYGDAERSFAEALRLDGNYEPAFRGLGVVHHARKNYTESIKYLKMSTALFPEDWSSHYFLGMNYYKTNAYGPAISHLRLFADAQPKHPTVHGILGVCYEKSNDPQSAYNEYTNQVKIDSSSEIGRLSASRAEAIKQTLR